MSREVLIKTKDIVQKSGYELIYADTDSVFIKITNGTTTTDQYEKLVSILRRETGLPISIEHDFKYLVLLPLEARMESWDYLAEDVRGLGSPSGRELNQLVE